MARLRLDFAGGFLSQDMQAADTVFVSPACSALPVIGSPDYMPVTLDPGGAPEIVHIVTHAASSASVTVVRAAEQAASNPALLHATGKVWLQAPTAADYDGRLLVATSSTLPSNPDDGLTVLQRDTVSVVVALGGTWSPVSGIPVGAIIGYAAEVAAAGTLTAPTGWLFCNGQAVTAAAYPNLFALLSTGGNPYGVDGSGNPLVPDMRNRRLAGAGGEYASGQTGGRDTYSLGVNDIPNHAHPIADPTHTHVLADGQHFHSGIVGNTGLGGANPGWLAERDDASPQGATSSPTGVHFTFASPSEVDTGSAFSNTSVQAHATGITGTGTITGHGAQSAVDMRSPYLAAPFIIKAT